ncbi:DNRLRE domain-containing protein [Nonomuraea sp. LP-02]|uniref:DNRLRE domain-containing protein n=1 Tax=Nonomuraea sp. LP-02 TaxID=3097960 RepID=UPI002E3395C5|nr:DNRLRE domain-containing protein [Nonomuraea sp. LP-02]MED7930543.1 DNRLRE domain-containing protein [Nonomuraea sp. LP-02]
MTLPLSLLSAPAIAQPPTPPPATTPTPATPPNASAAPAAAAKALAQAKKDKRRVEIESMRSESATFYANPDGKTVRMELSTRPIRIKNADGKGFTPIDTTLVEVDGAIRPKAAHGGLVLSTGRDKTLLKSQTADATATIGTPSALPVPTLKGSTATYPSAYGKGRDLVVTANATGFRQQIVIADRPTGPVSFRVPVDLPAGLSFKKNAADRPAIMGKDGKTITELRPTLLQDATATDRHAALDTGKAGKATVALAEDGRTLVFTPDAAFLADPATTYPVTVTAAASDWWEGHTGQWWRDGGAMDTWINDYDYQDSWDTFTQTQIVVGKFYASSIAKRWRGYLKFPDIPAEFAGRKVENADLHLWNYQSNECGISVGSGITARRITSSWDELTLTWNSQPSVTSTGADTEFGAYSEDCAGSMNYAWNLTHSLNRIVQAWVDGETNYGIQLTAGNESDLRNWRRYNSEDAGGCTTEPLEDCKFELHPPILSVDFELPPSPPEVIVYSYEGPRRAQPTYEEAVAMRVDTPGDIPDLPPMTAADEQALAARPNHVAEISPAELEPFTGESGEDSWDGTTIEDGSPADTVPPTVTSTVPVAEAREAPVDTPIQATFSEPVWEPAFSLKNMDGTVIDGTVSVDSADKVFTFTPAQPLKAGTTYTVEVSEAADASANPMTPFQWSFQTQGGARWSFDEGTGKTAADSFGRHPATLSDTAAWIAGKSGNAVSNVPSQARIIASEAAARQGKAVVVADETTATSITYAQPDGKTFKTEVSTGPVRARQGGGWVPIDTTLMEQGGTLRSKALADGAVVEISAGGMDPFVKMSADGKSYALRWPTPLPKPTVKGSVATYTDAAGVGADLVVTVLPDGFRHEVVLRQRPSKPLKLRIGVEDEGLTLSEGKNGRLLLKAKDKKLVAAAAPATVWDSAKGRPAKHGAAAADVVTKNGRTELVIEPDQAFLADAGTAYPVRVAAAVTLPGMTDVWISNYGTPGSSTYRNTTLWVGTYDEGEPEPWVERAYLKFDTAALTNVNVSAATLSMRRTEAYGCGDAQSGIKAQRVTAAWIDTALTWENQPGITTAGEAVANDSATCGAPGTMSWNLAAMAQAWASGSANHGLMLRGVDETLDGRPQYDRAFESFNATNKPTLSVTYTLGSTPTVAGLQISPATSAGGTVTATSLTPQLAATVADTAGGSLTGAFEVEHDPAATGQGSGQIWAGTSPAVSSGGQATVSIPAGKLADGWKIRWRARAANAATSSTSAWSNWQSATVDVPNPTVGAFQVTPSQVVDGAIVATSLTPALRATVTDPAAQPVRAEFQLEHDPAAPDGQGSGQIWAGAVDGVTSGTQASAAVPEGKLADGWKVRWRVRAVNTATTVGSPWSDWQALTVDAPDPVSDPSVGTLQVTPSEQVDGTTITPTRTPSLLAQVNDPARQALRAEAEIEHDPAAPDGQGSGRIWTGAVENVPAGTQANLTVPADTLSDGWKVRWRARAVSATATSAWSDWQSFTVSLPKPTATGLTISPSKVADGVTVTTTLTPALRATLTHPTGQALRAEAEIEHDPAAPDGQGAGQIWAGAADNVASGTQATIAVPAGELADGWKVRWRLRAVSGDASSAWSDWRQVTVDVTQPGEEPLAQTAGPVIRTDQSFTAAAWLRWSDKDGDYIILEQKGTHQAPFRLGNTPDHGLVFTFTSADAADATVEGVVSDVEPPVNEWFHLAGVYDATAKTASLYLNGNLVKTQPLSFAAWHAPQALTLGTSIQGDLDEARTYQRALSASEVGALAAGPAAPTSAPASAPRPAASGLAALDEPDPYEVDYRHFTLNTCRAKAPKEAIWGIWTDATVFSGCSVRWFGVSMWFDDFDPDTGTKKKVRLKLPDGEEGMDLMMRSTTVMNTYLGTRDGTAIRRPGSDGVTGPLTPQEFSMWVAFDQVDYDEATGIGNSRLELSVTSKPDTAASTCQKTVNGDREARVKEWDNTMRYYRFKSLSPGKDIRRCTVFPWAKIKDLVTDVGPSSFPLWDKLKDDKEHGVWTPPTVRCDDETMGPGSPGNWPEEKRVRYTGACIFPDVSRIYRTDVDHTKRGPVAAHIWAAFNTPDATDPRKEPGQKVIPGNWDGKTARARAALTRINENELRPGDPKNRTWKQVQVSERRKACRAAKVVGDCDEFPFNSVKEGPGWGDGNFSVRGVPASNNKSDGWYLTVFYARYRVLTPEGTKRPTGDRFWVSVRGTPSP